MTPEAAEARAQDVLEGNEDTTADATSQRAATDVAAEAEQTAESPGGDADETSAEAAPEPSVGEPRETTAVDEWRPGDEIGGAGGASSRGSNRGEEPRGEELDRLVSEATDPDGGPDSATDPDAWSPAGEPARDTVDGPVSDADAGDTERDPFSEADTPSSPGSGAERTADVSEPSDDEHGGASPGGDENGFEPDFEDVEDTTDEPGDWKPLDEDDL